VQVERSRSEASKVAARAALETALAPEGVEELRSGTDAAWRSEQDGERLRAMAVRVCEEALQRAKRMLVRVQRTRDTAVLREVGLDAVRTAGRDTLCAMAVYAAAKVGVDVNTREEGAAERWLVVAAEDGLVETVQALVAAGAEVDHANNYGCTALYPAAKEGHVEVILALVEAGAEVNHANNYGWTALYPAAKEGHAEAIRALVEAEAEVDHADSEGFTALHGAAINGRVEAIKALAEAGAEVDLATNLGRTAMLGAAENDHFLAIKALMDAGADPNRADHNRTPLAVARAYHHKAAALALVQAGATE
jgi:hypothetical protein